MTTHPYIYERVWEIYKKLRPKPEDLPSPARFFVRKGKGWFKFEQKKKRKKRHFFLFNDVLLICRKDGPSRYFLRIYITLRAQGVAVEPVVGLDYTLRLKTRMQNFMIYFQARDTFDFWMNELQLSITGKHPEEIKKKTTTLSTSDDGHNLKEFEAHVTAFKQDVEQIVSPSDMRKSTGVVKANDDSSDGGASSESPVQKRKKRARKSRRQRKTVEPKAADLYGLSGDFNFNFSSEPPLPPPVQLPANPFLSPPVGLPRSGISPFSIISPNTPLSNPFLVTPNVSAVTPLKNPFT